MPDRMTLIYLQDKPCLDHDAVIFAVVDEPDDECFRYDTGTRCKCYACFTTESRGEC